MSVVMYFALVGVVTLFYPQRAFCQPNENSIVFAATAASPSGVSAESGKKISMVIDTLKDILQSVTNEEKEETAIYNKYNQWCKTEKDSIVKDESDSKTQLANAKVLSEEQTSTMDSLNLFVTKTAKDLEETTDAVAQATGLRNSENEKYTEDLQINTESLRQIGDAIKHVSMLQHQGGFLQNGVFKKLQINQPGESSYVLGIMKGLNDRLQKSRDYMVQTEGEKVKMHAQYMTTKGTSLKAMQDSLTEKKITLAETTAKETGVQRKIGALTTDVERLDVRSSETTQACDSAEKEWKVRQQDRIKEKAALNEAIRYIEAVAKTSKSSLLQEDMSSEQLPVIRSDIDNDDTPAFFQVQSLSGDTDDMADDIGFTDMMSEDSELQGHMQKETFKGVQSVVMKLIGSHQETQTEETDKKEYCAKELANKDDEKATTSDILDAVKAEIDKKSAEVVTLEDEVKKLYDSQSELRKNVEAAGKVRQQENTLFTSTTKDRKLAMRVLSQAKRVLQSFYDDQGNLLQVGASSASSHSADPSPPSSSQRKKVASLGAVSMIQDIIDDITKEQKDAEIQEKQSADAFVQLQEDTQRTNDEKQQDITDRVTSKAKLNVQINSLKETKTEKTDELTAINKQLTSLHSSCDELLQNYDKRKTARVFEVSQLRDAYDILSGSSIAARTGGFVQEEDDARTVALEAQLQNGE